MHKVLGLIPNTANEERKKMIIIMTLPSSSFSFPSILNCSVPKPQRGQSKVSVPCEEVVMALREEFGG
jgi:hypothetical protein